MRYKNSNIGQTISPWEHLLNFIKNKSQRAHGTSYFVKKTRPSDTKNDMSIRHFFFHTLLIDRNKQQIYVHPLQIIYANLKL